MFRRSGQISSKKLQKVSNFAKKHQKSSIWLKLETSSSKPACFGVSVNFSAKSFKKYLISRRSIKNRRFRQNVKFSPANNHVSALSQVFRKKLQKVPHFGEKHEKSSIRQKCATFSTKPRCFVVWVNISAKSWRKCLISRKSMKNRRFGKNVQLFRANHHVSAFSSTFKQKVAKSASFREKPSKIVNLAKM